MKTMRVELLNEEALARVAKVLGEQSAAAMALEEAKLRRGRGEAVTLVKHRDTIVVIPSKSIRNH